MYTDTFNINLTLQNTIVDTEHNTVKAFVKIIIKTANDGMLWGQPPTPTHLLVKLDELE
mgnify:CR=1 FL=1